MTRKIINLLTNLLLISIFIFIFIYSNIVKQTIIYGINTWLYTLIPSMFPFLLITKILIYKNSSIKINNIVIILLSLITGFPTGAIYVKELLNNNSINIEDANKLIMYTSYSSPAFVISIVGELLLSSKSLGLFIYIMHILSGLLIFLLFRIKINNYQCIINKNNNILFKSINDTFEVLVNILGIIIFFLIILSIINTLLPDNLLFIIIKSFLEITTGTIKIANHSMNLKLKLSIIGAIISFNGLSVHYQVKSIIENTKIKYNNYLYARIIHSIICFILIYFSYELLV